MVKQSHVLLTLKGLQKEFLLLLVAIEFDLTLGRRRYSRASIARVRCSMGEANNAICGRTIRITVFSRFFAGAIVFVLLARNGGGGEGRGRYWRRYAFHGSQLQPHAIAFSWQTFSPHQSPFIIGFCYFSTVQCVFSAVLLFGAKSLLLSQRYYGRTSNATTAWRMFLFYCSPVAHWLNNLFICPLYLFKLMSSSTLFAYKHCKWKHYFFAVMPSM